MLPVRHVSMLTLIPSQFSSLQAIRDVEKGELGLCEAVCSRAGVFAAFHVEQSQTTSKQTSRRHFMPGCEKCSLTAEHWISQTFVMVLSCSETGRIFQDSSRLV